MIIMTQSPLQNLTKVKRLYGQNISVVYLNTHWECQYLMPQSRSKLAPYTARRIKKKKGHYGERYLFLKEVGRIWSGSTLWFVVDIAIPECHFYFVNEDMFLLYLPRRIYFVILMIWIACHISSNSFVILFCMHTRVINREHLTHLTYGYHLRMIACRLSEHYLSWKNKISYIYHMLFYLYISLLEINLLNWNLISCLL